MALVVMWCEQMVKGKPVTEVMNGALTLMDLAGTEKLKDSNATGKTKQEATVRPRSADWSQAPGLVWTCGPSVCTIQLASLSLQVHS